MFDLFIEQPKIADGTGKPIYTANVGIRDGKIAYIGQAQADPGQKTLRLAPQEVLCPGFIDSHGHSECYLFHDPCVTPKLRQGVTTEVSGNCGIGFAPVNPAYLAELKDNFEGVAVGLDFPDDWKNMTSFGRFLDRVEGLHTEINTAFYVAHGALRIAVKGYDGTPLTPAERERVHELLTEAMEAGAVGMSTGFVYAPGTYADFDEIVDLCRIVSRYGGVYATHMKDEGDHVIESVTESIEVARRTGVRLLISHHKVTGVANAPHIKEIHRLVNEARAEGLSVHLDQYPYSAGETTLNTTIPYRYLDGGNQMLLKRLEDPTLRAEITDAILHNDGTWQNPLDSTGFDGMTVLHTKCHPECHGKSLAQLAAEWNVEPVETIFRLLKEHDGQVNCLLHFMTDADVETIFKSPLVSVCTDSLLFGEGMPTHPRGYSTYPRILGRFVREKGLVSFEEAIRKMSAMPADIFGMKHKGRILEGMDADLVVVDPERVIDHGDYENPYAENEGIEMVFVAGQLVLNRGVIAPAGAGRVVRKKDGCCC